jgi:hypothetical protein
MRSLALVLIIFTIIVLAAVGGGAAWWYATQASPPVSEEKSLETAHNYVLHSSTFRFDGIEGSLTHIETLYPNSSSGTWEFVFTFQCRHSGYGDRTGQNLLQVITPHTADLVVQRGKVISAELDGKWDMIKEELLPHAIAAMITCPFDNSTYVWTPIGTRSENFNWLCLENGHTWTKTYQEELYREWRHAFLPPEYVRDYTLLYVRVVENKQDLPNPLTITWTGGRETPEGLVGGETYIYRAEGGVIVTIHYPVVLPENITYSITIESQGDIWQGTLWKGQLFQRQFTPLIILKGELETKPFPPVSEVTPTVLVWAVHQEGTTYYLTSYGKPMMSLPDGFTEGTPVEVKGILYSKESWDNKTHYSFLEEYQITQVPVQIDIGFLEGKVTVGHISPVEHEGQPSPTPPEVYAARKIIVYDHASGEIVKADIDTNGTYKVALKPGTYTVDINHAGIDRSSDVPRQIVIEPGLTVHLDITIDTGIR